MTSKNMMNINNIKITIPVSQALFKPNHSKAQLAYILFMESGKSIEAKYSQVTEGLQNGENSSGYGAHVSYP